MDWIREVRGLHEFFERWIRGDAVPTEFERLEAALAEGFSMVGPHGDLQTRDEVIAHIERARGARSELRITVHSFEELVRTAEIVVGRYVERHEEADGQAHERTTMAVFHIGSGGDPRWLVAHETSREDR